MNYYCTHSTSCLKLPLSKTRTFSFDCPSKQQRAPPDTNYGLFKSLKNTLNKYGEPYNKEPIYRDFRKGDVRHSQADITKAVQYLNYNPEYKVLRGIELAMPWYLNNQTQVDFD